VLKLHDNTWYEIKIRLLLKMRKGSLILRPRERTEAIYNVSEALIETICDQTVSGKIPRRFLWVGSRGLRGKMAVWYTQHPKLLCNFYSVNITHLIGRGLRNIGRMAAGCKRIFFLCSSLLFSICGGRNGFGTHSSRTTSVISLSVSFHQSSVGSSSIVDAARS
jgi:hypothetical protein